MVTKNFTLLAVVTASLLGSQLHAAEQQLLEGVPVYDLATETTVAALAVTDNLSVRPEAGLRNEHTHDNASDCGDRLGLAYLMQHHGYRSMSEEALRQHLADDPNSSDLRVVISSGPHAGHAFGAVWCAALSLKRWDDERAENARRDEDLRIARERNAALVNAAGRTLDVVGTEAKIVAHQTGLVMKGAAQHVGNAMTTAVTGTSRWFVNNRGKLCLAAGLSLGIWYGRNVIPRGYNAGWSDGYLAAERVARFRR